MITEAGEESVESGTIRAKDASEAEAKLNQYGFNRVQLDAFGGCQLFGKGSRLTLSELG